MFTYAFVCVCVCVCVCASVSVSVCSPLNAHLKVDHTDTRTFKCVVFQGRRRLCRCRCVSGATALHWAAYFNETEAVKVLLWYLTIINNYLILTIII